MYRLDLRKHSYGAVEVHTTCLGVAEHSGCCQGKWNPIKKTFRVQFFSSLKMCLNYLISEYCYMSADCSTTQRLHGVSLITSSYLLNFLVEQGDFICGIIFHNERTCQSQNRSHSFLTLYFHSCYDPCWKNHASIHLNSNHSAKSNQILHLQPSLPSICLWLS